MPTKNIFKKWTWFCFISIKLKLVLNLKKNEFNRYLSTYLKIVNYDCGYISVLYLFDGYFKIRITFKFSILNSRRSKYCIDLTIM